MMKNKNGNRKFIRVMSVIAFLVYMVILIYFVFLSDGFSRDTGYTEYRYNLVPFLEIKRFMTSSSLSLGVVITNMAGNVAAFVPFGALFRWVRNKKIGWFKTTFITFLFSLLIETIQLITRVGVFDVDDLILNTLGGLIGYIVYIILAHSYNRYIQRRDSRR